MQETSNRIGNIAYYCNVKITHFINNLNTYDYEEKQYLGSPSENYHRRCNRSLDRNGNNSMHGTMSNNYLTPHFTLAEFCNLQKYPANVPSSQHVANIIYGCSNLLEPARQAIGCPIIINSGFRNADVNAQVGGVKNSQHQQGQAADIRPKDPAKFQQLVDFLKACEFTDQLLTGSGWLHISWSPFRPPRHFVRLGYYK